MSRWRFALFVAAALALVALLAGAGNVAGSPATTTAPPALSIPSDPPPERWNRTYGQRAGTFDEAVVTGTDSLLAVGSLVSPDGNELDGFVVSVTTNGTEQWRRRYGGTGDDVLTDAYPTADGGALLVGTSVSQGPGAEDGWALRIDAQGNVEWRIATGGPGDDEFTGVERTRNGFLIAGTRTEGTTENTDGWLVSVRENGDLRWTKTYDTTVSDSVAAIDRRPGGGFVLAGRTSPTGDPRDDGWVLLVDGDGNRQHQYIFGGRSTDEFRAVAATNASGIVLAGASRSFGDSGERGWVLSIDEDRTERWRHTYATGPMTDVATADDGGVVLTSETRSETGLSDAVLAGIHPSGQRAWTLTRGGDSFDSFEGIARMAGDGHVLAGSTGSYGDGETAWLLKVGGQPGEPADDGQPPGTGDGNVTPPESSTTETPVVGGAGGGDDGGSGDGEAAEGAAGDDGPSLLFTVGAILVVVVFVVGFLFLLWDLADRPVERLDERTPYVDLTVVFNRFNIGSSSGGQGDTRRSDGEPFDDFHASPGSSTGDDPFGGAGGTPSGASGGGGSGSGPVGGSAGAGQQGSSGGGPTDFGGAASPGGEDPFGGAAGPAEGETERVTEADPLDDSVVDISSDTASDDPDPATGEETVDDDPLGDLGADTGTDPADDVVTGDPVTDSSDETTATTADSAPGAAVSDDADGATPDEVAGSEAAGGDEGPGAAGAAGASTMSLVPADDDGSLPATETPTPGTFSLRNVGATDLICRFRCHTVDEVLFDYWVDLAPGATRLAYATPTDPPFEILINVQDELVDSRVFVNNVHGGTNVTVAVSEDSIDIRRSDEDDPDASAESDAAGSDAGDATMASVASMDPDSDTDPLTSDDAATDFASPADDSADADDEMASSPADSSDAEESTAEPLVDEQFDDADGEPMPSADEQFDDADESGGDPLEDAADDPFEDPESVFDEPVDPSLDDDDSDSTLDDPAEMADTDDSAQRDVSSEESTGTDAADADPLDGADPLSDSGSVFDDPVDDEDDVAGAEADESADDPLDEAFGSDADEFEPLPDDDSGQGDLPSEDETRVDADGVDDSPLYDSDPDDASEAFFGTDPDAPAADEEFEDTGDSLGSDLDDGGFFDSGLEPDPDAGDGDDEDDTDSSGGDLLPPEDDSPSDEDSDDD